MCIRINKQLEVTYIPFLEYGQAWETQKKIVKTLDQSSSVEQLLLLQHTATYTIGSQQHPDHLLLSAEQLEQRGIRIYKIDRGGDITYHGPGQLVGYPLLRIGDGQHLDLHRYLRDLEQVIIDYLSKYSVKATRKSPYTGVWVGDKKIAAIGVKFNKCKHRRGFVTSHGFALNIKKECVVEGFSHIIPCGIAEYGITCLEELTQKEIAVKQVAEDIVPFFTKVFCYTNVSVTYEKEEEQG